MRLTSRGWGSFHALPASAGHSLVGSAFEQVYLDLFGANLLIADVTASGGVLDSFFRPRGCLANAQRLAARAFGADLTLFMTCGTTMTNVVALDAFTSLVRPSDRTVRALVDRTCHQSIHFGLHRACAEVTYCRQHVGCDPYDRTWADIDDLVGLYKQAAAAGKPFDLVVLSSGSYDGGIIDLRALFGALLADVDELAVLVDEAWTGILAFHPRLRQLTALDAAAAAQRDRPDRSVRLIVTHSAHKSMSALRQGSYMHVLGDEELCTVARHALYRHHTTSPSMPILASLDLARAQAEMEGAALLERSMAYTSELARLFAPGTGTGTFVVGPSVGANDLALLLDLGRSHMSPDELRTRLARDYGLYIARTTGTGAVLRFHIGVTPGLFARLVEALVDLSQADVADEARVSPTGFVVAYPPGIPLTVPGEIADESSDRRATALRSSGAELFTL
jgi:arginine/lysine/ornithine decarboxylase